jgi:hypothetical protein
MPISDDATLRGFIEHLLGWSDERTVELAARTLALALGHRATLVLCVLCIGQLAKPHPAFILPAPLAVPPLARRSAELDRIIAEYAGDGALTRQRRA